MSVDVAIKEPELKLIKTISLPAASMEDEIRPDINLDNETIAAMNEYYEMKIHPEKYKRYSSFRDAVKDILQDA